MVVLVAGQRQAEAFDRVGEEADGAIVVDRLEGVDQRWKVVPGEVGHQPRQRRVIARRQKRCDSGPAADVGLKPPAPRGAALEDEARIFRIGTGIDPFAKRLAARLRESSLKQPSVFQDDHLPTERAEDVDETGVEPLAHDRVEALPVVVDDPPSIAEPLLPPLKERLEDIALVELRVADERDHPPFRLRPAPAVRLHVVLHEAREDRLCHAEPDGTRGEVDVVGILGARRV